MWLKYRVHRHLVREGTVIEFFSLCSRNIPDRTKQTLTVVSCDLFQGIEYEVCASGVADTPADNVPGKHADDEGHLQPALPGRHVGEVRHIHN